MFLTFARLVLALVLVAPAASAAAQSQAINGTIEGTVLDAQGAVLPGVTITVANIDTGDQRVVVTNDSGLFRAPLLTLGAYRVTAELQGFRKFEQTGVRLSAGSTAVINITLTVGAVAETITVVADSPIVDLAKIEQGRTLNEAEIKTLPLTSRNPYNFALLQPGVVGFENNEFGVAAPHREWRAAARQLPGGRQQQHAEGSRRPAADADVRSDDPRGQGRHQRLRAGVRPDDGPGLQRDHAVGHQPVQGAGQLPLAAEADGGVPVLHPRRAHVRSQAADRRQRLHRRSRRADRQGQDALLRRLRAHRTRSLGPQRHHDYAGEPGGARHHRGPLHAARSEHRVRDRQGRSADQPAAATSRSATCSSTISSPPTWAAAWCRCSARRTSAIGSIRPAHSWCRRSVRRRSTSCACSMRRARRRAFPNALSGTGPAINITGVANIGGPVSGTANAGFGFTQDVLQVNDSATLLKGDHAFKAGLDIQHVADTRTSSLGSSTRSPTLRRIWRRVTASNRLGYTSFTQYFGLPDLEYSTEPVRCVRAGRLARQRGPEGALRRALRPVRRAGRRGQRADRDVAPSSQCRRATSRRASARCGPRRLAAVGAARQHRHHVRPDDQRRSTSRRWPTTAPTLAPPRR